MSSSSRHRISSCCIGCLPFIDPTNGRIPVRTISIAIALIVLTTAFALAQTDALAADAGPFKVTNPCLIPIAADVDPKSGEADAKIDLGGKPEFLAADGAGKAYINLEDKDQVAVVDTKEGKVLDHWPVAPGGSPVGMAIDPEHHRLFI